MARESIRSALLPVDDAHGRMHDEPGLTQRHDRVEEGAPGGDDVLDEADALAFLEGALDPLGGPVLLRLLADDDEGQAGFERGRGSQGDGPELRAGEAGRVGRVLPYRRCDPLPERLQQVGTRLEAVFVEVVARSLSRPEQEVALEVRMLDERAGERVVAHDAAAPSTSRATGSSFSASGDPSTSETIEPSSK